MMRVELLGWGAIYAALAMGATPPSKPSLRCAISRSEAGGVDATVENAAGGSINADVYPSFLLQPKIVGGSEYWAPVDLETGRPYFANNPRHLNLKAGQSIRRILAPASLFWNRKISSVWPEQPLCEAVPYGRYELRLEIQGPRGASSSKSNPLEVEVDAAGLSILSTKR